MLDKLAAIEAKYSQIEARLAAPETYDDPAQVAKLNKEQNELAPVVETYRQYLRAQEQKEESEALLSDPEMKELAQEEFHQAKADLERLEQEQRQIEQKIKLFLGESQGAENLKYRVSWSNVDTQRVDSRRLKEEQPDVYSRFSKVSHSRKFTVKAE